MNTVTENEPACQCERLQWADYCEKMLDLAVLAEFCERALLSAEIPCVCVDATCLRCRAEEVVARYRGVPENVAAEVFKDDEVPF